MQEIQTGELGGNELGDQNLVLHSPGGLKCYGSWVAKSTKWKVSP